MHSADLRIDEVDYTCRFNGDFSGNVIVQIPIRDVPMLKGLLVAYNGEEVAQVQPSHPMVTAEVRIPFQLMKALVGRYIIDGQMRRLVQTSGEECIDHVSRTPCNCLS